MAGDGRPYETDSLPVPQSWQEAPANPSDGGRLPVRPTYGTEDIRGLGIDDRRGTYTPVSQPTLPSDYWPLPPPPAPIAEQPGPAASYYPDAAARAAPYTFAQTAAFPSGLPALTTSSAGQASTSSEWDDVDERSSWTEDERKKSLKLSPTAPYAPKGYRALWSAGRADDTTVRYSALDDSDAGVARSAYWPPSSALSPMRALSSSVLARQPSWPPSFLTTTGTPTSASPAYSQSLSSVQRAAAASSASTAHPDRSHLEYRAEHPGYIIAPRPMNFISSRYTAPGQLGPSAPLRKMDSPSSSLDIPAGPPPVARDPSSSHDAYSFLSTSHPFLSTTPALPTAPAAASFLSSAPHTTFPVDISSPYIPRQGGGFSDAVIKAAAYRQSIGKIDLTGRFSEKQPSRRVPVSQSLRRLVELNVSCLACNWFCARLSLRGGQVEQPVGNEASKYNTAFYCSICIPLPPYIGQARAASTLGHEDPYAGECTYYDSLSCAVDQYLGEDVVANDTRPPPVPPNKSPLGFVPYDVTSEASKKRKDSVVSEVEGMLACDVCRRDVGSGQLSLAETGEAVGSTIEVLCAHCDSRYLRCSDCGGGGGNKGVGRWRCKEMFPIGRKTCQLPHSRLGLVEEMDYDVWPLESLTDDERDTLNTQCRNLQTMYILAALAVPDMIESVVPLGRSFEEVEKLTVDSWGFLSLLHQPCDPASGLRRYLAVRWVNPMSRKKRAKRGPGFRSDQQSSSDDQRMPNSPPSWQPPAPVRSGKTLTGFVSGEYEMEKGILHVGVAVPTGAGEAFEATSRLLQSMIARVVEDTIYLNMERAQRNLPPYPILHTAWMMHMTKRDSRIMSRLETRRGFIPLEDFLLKYPEINIKNFPPYRDTYLQPEFLRGFMVWAKAIRTEDLPPDYSGPARAAIETVQNGRPPAV